MKIELTCGRLIAGTIVLAGLIPLYAQQPMNSNMPGMNMSDENDAGKFLQSFSSGTSLNPAAWPMPMYMTSFGSWNTMFMGQGFLNDIQQSGPRGGDKLYSPNWFMANAEHDVGDRGAFGVVLMLSLEPATITERRYPLLFQTGETAFGVPIVDGQHPHNLIMALAVQYAYKLSDRWTLELYAAPMGDPALGPVAFPHRASAMEMPEAPIAHHWQDSTHIAYEVVTAGLAYKQFRLEASGFNGAEPNENRWTIGYGPIDSWSTRVWFLPSSRWAAQVSAGHLTHPEALEPGDQTRLTASLAYSKPLWGDTWSTTGIWGRDHSTYTKRNTNAYTLESVLPAGKRNFITGRAELVAKDDLFADDPLTEQYLDTYYGSTFRVGEYTLGYTRDIPLFRNVETGIGANLQLYSLPDAIKPYYGNRPIGGNMFLRIRLRPPA